MTPKILCIGALIIDIINDALPRMLNAGEGVNTKIEIQLGGNAYNVSIDLIRLGLLDAHIACLGAVGNDYMGELFRRELQNHGVIPLIYPVSEAGTSKNLILQIQGEERRYHYDEGANVCLGLDFVLNHIRDFRPTLLCIGEIGSLGGTGKKLKQILEIAKGIGCITVLDVIIPPNEDWQNVYEAAGLIDIFHCNDYEAQSLTGKTDMREVIQELLRLGIELPLISLGERGLLCAIGGNYYTIPAFKVRSVDATGAGDAFTAGFIKKLLELEGDTLQDKFGDPLRDLYRPPHYTNSKLFEAILFAEAAGAVCVTALGCTQAVDEKKVFELLESQSRQVLSAVTSDEGIGGPIPQKGKTY